MFYFALRILLYNKVRFLVTLVGLVFAVGLIFAQMGIYLGLMENASIVIDHTPGEIWITSKNCRNFEFSQPFPEFIHNHVSATEGVQWAEKLIIAWGIIKNKNGGSEQVEIIGFNPDTGIGGPWKMKAGEPWAVKNGDFIILDDSATKRVGQITVGDYREVLGRRLQIVGISEGVRSFTTAPFVFASYRTAQKVAGHIGYDQTVFIVAKVSPGYSVSSVVKSLKKKLSGVDVYSKEAFSRKTRLYWTIETGVGFSFFITILISFFVGMLIVGQTIYNSAVEHVKEYGTLKAMGASNWEINKILLSQASVSAGLGYLVSLFLTLLSVKLYQWMEIPMAMKEWATILVLGLSVAMCFSASFFSMRKIRNIDPAILFRG